MIFLYLVCKRCGSYSHAITCCVHKLITTGHNVLSYYIIFWGLKGYKHKHRAKIENIAVFTIIVFWFMCVVLCDQTLRLLMGEFRNMKSKSDESVNGLFVLCWHACALLSIMSKKKSLKLFLTTHHITSFILFIRFCCVLFNWPFLIWSPLIVDNSLFLRKSIRFPLKIAGLRVGLLLVMVFALLRVWSY